MEKTNSIRLHKNLVAAVVQALESCFGQNVYADKVIERILKSNRKWGARDRGFLAENTYEIVRHWRKLWAIYGQEPSVKRKELYKIFGIHFALSGNELPDWPAFDNIRNIDWKEKAAQLPNDIAIQESFPDWLSDIISQELGDQWPEVAQTLNKEAHLILRNNALKCERKQVMEAFTESKAEASALPQPNAILLQPKINTFTHETFKQGWFEVQDAGSQEIAPFLEVAPGMRVIDACAGAGGKTLHLAALMQNKGQIIAMDVSDYKLAELKKRAKRNGANNIETRLIDSTKVIKRLHESADRLLLDVPCSGLGVIKRNPDTKWKLQPEHLDRVRKMQKDILQNYSAMLKPSGILVYATCSILASENDQQVASFLAQNPEFELLDSKTLYPTEFNDGFFMAKIKRNLPSQ